MRLRVRPCGSSSSPAPARRLAVGEWRHALKLREDWKYARLRKALGERPHEFEYGLGGYVYDLALLDTHVLVEFDGPDHRSRAQRAVDRNKGRVARANGFTVVRRAVRPMAVIEPSALEGL